MFESYENQGDIATRFMFKRHQIHWMHLVSVQHVPWIPALAHVKRARQQSNFKLLCPHTLSLATAHTPHAHTHYFNRVRHVLG